MPKMPDPEWSPKILGRCVDRGDVTNGACMQCYWDRYVTRDAAMESRQACMAIHITRPDDITGYDLARLSEASIRGILGNIALVANHNRNEATSATALREIRLHLSQETPNEDPK